eukprot:Sspe_Gene.91169::Locus_62634_Transcript_1_1_Confidence_1.000_Length_1943::g.91169::m.91169
MLVEDPFHRDYTSLTRGELECELQKADERLRQLSNQLDIADLFPQIERLQGQVADLEAQNKQLMLQLGDDVHTDMDITSNDNHRSHQLNSDVTELELLELREQCAAFSAELRQTRNLRDQAEDALDKMREEAAVLRRELDRARDEAEQKVAIMEKKLTESTSALKDAEERAAREKQTVERLQEALQGREKAVMHLRHQLGAAEGELKRLESFTESDLSALRNAVNSSVDEAAALRHENVRLLEEKETLEERVEAAEGSLRALEASCRELQEALAAKQRSPKQETLDKLKRRAEAAESDLAAKQEELAEARKAVAAYEEQVEHEEAKVARLTGRIKEQGSIIHDLQEAHEKARDEACALRKELTAANASLRDARQTVDETSRSARKMQKMKEQIDLLTKRVAQLDEEKAEGARKAAKQTQKAQEAVAACKRHEASEKALQNELAASVSEVKALKAALRENDHQALKKKVHELEVSNSVLKEMVRSANINARVIAAKGKRASVASKERDKEKEKDSKSAAPA